MLVFNLKNETLRDKDKMDAIYLKEVAPDVKKVFNHLEAKLAFTSDIFWTKASVGAETINLWLETYQMTRNFEPRGIVEVIIND